MLRLAPGVNFANIFVLILPYRLTGKQKPIIPGMVMNKHYKFFIRNKNNDNLAAIWYAQSRRTVESTKRLIIFCHGFTGTKEGRGRALEMSESLLLKGHDSLLFDFSGCGESEGSWHDLTLTGQIDDLSSVVNWSAEQDYSEFIVAGRSFGGTTAICYTPSDSRVVGVSSWAAVARPLKLFSSSLVSDEAEGEGLIILKSSEGQVSIKKEFIKDLEKHDILNYVDRIKRSNFLVIHGTRDQDVPPDDAALIWQKAHEPKKLVMIKGADHTFSEHRNKLWNAFCCWLKSID